MATIVNSLPTPEEAAMAKVSCRELAAYLDLGRGKPQKLTVSDDRGDTHTIEIPSSALRFFIDVLTQLGEGNSVSLIPIHAEMTTQEGADILGISRPTFIRLLDDNVIPYHRVGNRRKVKYQDVHEYKQKIDEERLKVLAELSELDQELGMGYE